MAPTLEPDLVLMDVNLPGINGLDATRKILDGDPSARIVILLLSTYEEEEYAPRAAECGAAAYIPKAAFGPDRLEAAWAAATGASLGRCPRPATGRVSVVPSPGADSHLERPADRIQPVGHPLQARAVCTAAGSNPAPSSATANVRTPSVVASRTVAC